MHRAYGKKKSGKIRLADREVDDETEIIKSPELEEGHVNNIIETKSCATENKNCREYRNRLKRIISYWDRNHVYHSYHEVGTRLLRSEEKDDQVKFHWKNERDIIYSGLNVSMVKAYLSDKNKKKVLSDWRVILSSVSDIKKYDAAIKWGCQCADERFPSNYHIEMEAYITSYQKEYKQAQK